MRIFFIGTVEFSSHSLQTLINERANIIGACIKSSSEFNADYVDLKPILEKHNIPYKSVNDINHPNNVKFIRDLSPDVIYCMGWSSLLKDEILNIPSKGVIGYHPAALPFNRGRHPLIWALALGLESTASTFFRMDRDADTGDIISQEPVSISLHDSAESLYQRITAIAIEQLSKITRDLQEDSVVLIKQDKQIGNSWRKRGINDGKIDFRMHSRTIYNLVRALTKPYVGAHISIPERGDVKVWEVVEDVCTQNNIEPGKILQLESGKIKVKTADGAVWLLKHNFSPDNLPQIGEYL